MARVFEELIMQGIKDDRGLPESVQKLAARRERLTSPRQRLYFDQGRLALMKPKQAMVNRIPITQARVNLGAVVKRVRLNGEYFILEKDGIPVAGIMGADELEDYLELRDPAVRDQIGRAHV